MRWLIFLLCAVVFVGATCSQTDSYEIGDPAQGSTGGEQRPLAGVGDVTKPSSDDSSGTSNVDSTGALSCKTEAINEFFEEEPIGARALYDFCSNLSSMVVENPKVEVVNRTEYEAKVRITGIQQGCNECPRVVEAFVDLQPTSGILWRVVTFDGPYFPS